MSRRHGNGQTHNHKQHESAINGDLHEQRGRRRLAGLNATTARIVHHQRHARQVQRRRHRVREECAKNQGQRGARVHALAHGLEAKRVAKALGKILAQLGEHGRHQRNQRTLLDGFRQLDKLVSA